MHKPNFEKLYKLTQSSINCREDFLTELLKFYLNDNKERGKKFIVKLIANTFGRPNEIKYDKNYDCDSQVIVDNENRLDLKIESEDYVIIFENKINSEEGKNQLPRYINYLKQKENSYKFLFYVTKQNEKKEIEIIGDSPSGPYYDNITWDNLYLIIRECDMQFPSFISEELIQYMEYHNMNHKEKLNSTDIDLLKKIKKIELLRESFENPFNYFTNKPWQSHNNIEGDDFYGIKYDFNVGGQKYSPVFLN